MYIKAKYPKVGNEFGGPNAGPQGFGSLYVSNTESDVTQIIRNETIIVEHDGDFNN